MLQLRRVKKTFEKKPFIIRRIFIFECEFLHKRIREIITVITFEIENGILKILRIGIGLRILMNISRQFVCNIKEVDLLKLN